MADGQKYKYNDTEYDLADLEDLMGSDPRLLGIYKDSKTSAKHRDAILRYMARMRANDDAYYASLDDAARRAADRRDSNHYSTVTFRGYSDWFEQMNRDFQNQRNISQQMWKMLYDANEANRLNQETDNNAGWYDPKYTDNPEDDLIDFDPEEDLGDGYGEDDRKPDGPDHPIDVDPYRDSDGDGRPDGDGVGFDYKGDLEGFDWTTLDDSIASSWNNWWADRGIDTSGWGDKAWKALQLAFPGAGSLAKYLFKDEGILDSIVNGDTPWDKIDWGGFGDIFKGWDPQANWTPEQEEEERRRIQEWMDAERERIYDPHNGLDENPDDDINGPPNNPDDDLPPDPPPYEDPDGGGGDFTGYDPRKPPKRLSMQEAYDKYGDMFDMPGYGGGGDMAGGDYGGLDPYGMEEDAGGSPYDWAAGIDEYDGGGPSSWRKGLKKYGGGGPESWGAGLEGYMGGGPDSWGPTEYDNKYYYDPGDSWSQYTGKPGGGYTSKVDLWGLAGDDAQGPNAMIDHTRDQFNRGPGYEGDPGGAQKDIQFGFGGQMTQYNETPQFQAAAAQIDEQTNAEMDKLREEFGASGMRWSTPLQAQQASTLRQAAQDKNKLLLDMDREEFDKAYSRSREEQDAIYGRSKELEQEGYGRWDTEDTKGWDRYLSGEQLDWDIAQGKGGMQDSRGSRKWDRLFSLDQDSYNRLSDQEKQAYDRARAKSERDYGRWQDMDSRDYSRFGDTRDRKREAEMEKRRRWAEDDERYYGRGKEKEQEGYDRWRYGDETEYGRNRDEESSNYDRWWNKSGRDYGWNKDMESEDYNRYQKELDDYRNDERYWSERDERTGDKYVDWNDQNMKDLIGWGDKDSEWDQDFIDRDFQEWMRTHPDSNMKDIIGFLTGSGSSGGSIVDVKKDQGWWDKNGSSVISLIGALFS